MEKLPSDDVIYESVSELLVSRLPELSGPYRELLEWWGDEKPGPHVVYEDVLCPYIDELLQSEDKDALGRVFALIEQLSRSSDARVRDVVTASICEHIASNEARLDLARSFMGKLTRARCDDVTEFRPKY